GRLRDQAGAVLGGRAGEERADRRADERTRGRGCGCAALDQRRARGAREEPGREEGLREAAPHRKEARRDGGPAPRASDREVHRRRGVGFRAAAGRAVIATRNRAAVVAEEGGE